VAAAAEAPTGPEVIREKKEEPDAAAGAAPKDKEQKK
jgi:hypothetical protein